MASPKVEGEGFFEVDHFFINDQINKVIAHIEPQIEKVIKGHILFHAFFLLATVLEVFLLMTFFAFLIKSSLFAFSLAFIFLTIFTYFILRIYFQTKKPEQLADLKDRYLKACKHLVGYKEGVPEHHVALANACCKFASFLDGKEYTYYKPPAFLQSLAPTLERFSCQIHWEDFHLMKELLLNNTIEEYLRLVRFEPTNLEVHAALANAYVMLSGLYTGTNQVDGETSDRWIPPQKTSEVFAIQFRKTAERAIEEFKILNDYAPDDPWIHEQLAYSYHDLRMPQEEIREYEAILKLCPNDLDTLFKLGALYFHQGSNAQGLRVYEELKRANYKKAEYLIEYYGSYHKNLEVSRN
jgi:tetratricopeptide (TPR) repeat protein